MPACPKPRPRLLDKRDAAAKVRAIDEAERKKCKQRSGGRCEVVFVSKHMSCPGFVSTNDEMWFERCGRTALHNHHLLGGIGRRNKGWSIFADYRLDVCNKCHDDITGHVLRPWVNKSNAEWADRVVYERVK